MEFIVHESFLRKKCFSFYDLFLLFNGARVKLKKLFSPTKKSYVMSKSPKIFNTPAISNTFLTPTLNMVLTAIMFDSF